MDSESVKYLLSQVLNIVGKSFANYKTILQYSDMPL